MVLPIRNVSANKNRKTEKWGLGVAISLKKAYAVSITSVSHRAVWQRQVGDAILSVATLPLFHFCA
jgi:hypothetical protein